MNRKPIFFTSDWHIGHKNVLIFDKRPFDSIEEMHETLIKRYNSTVPENGVCYFLGDMGAKADEVRPIIDQLNGTKVLIVGNHDKGVFSGYNAGFDVCLYSGHFFVGEDKVTMSHCPLLGVFREDVTAFGSTVIENWHGETRQKHQRSALKDEGQFHLHGHGHARKGKEGSHIILGRQYDIGVCGNNYTPVSLSTIESWIANHKKENDAN